MKHIAESSSKMTPARCLMLICVTVAISYTDAKSINQVDNHSLLVVIPAVEESSIEPLIRTRRSYKESAFFKIEKGKTNVLYDQSAIGSGNPDFWVTNLGQTSVYARYASGDKVLGEATLKPGETANFDLPMSISITSSSKFEVKNLASDRIAFVYAQPKSYSDVSVTWPDFITRLDASAILKEATLFGLGKIPVGGDVLAFTVGIFWPEPETKKVDIWSEIKDQVKDLIDKSTTETINGILNGRVKRWERRFKEFSKDVRSKNSSELSSHYLNIAQDFIGVENEFSSMGNVRSNFYVIPFYSSVILMKLMFYTYGLNCNNELGLSPGDVASITRYRDSTLKEANDYLPKLYADMLEYQYQNLDPKKAYTTLADIRTLYAEYGSEYIKMWNHLAKNSRDQLLFDDIHYSRNILGTKTGSVNALLTGPPQQPFTPNLVSPGKRSKLVKLSVCWSTHRFWKLGGFRLAFDSGESYDIGKECFRTPAERMKLIDIDLAKKYINKIEMKTDKKSYIVQLKFYFTDNSAAVSMGDGKDSVKDWKWQEEGYVVSSLYTTPAPGEVFVNLVVSYQRNNDIETKKYLPAKCK